MGNKPDQYQTRLVIALAAPPAKGFISQVGQGQYKAAQHGYDNLSGMGVEPVAGGECSQYQAYSRQPSGQNSFLSVLAEANPERRHSGAYHHESKQAMREFISGNYMGQCGGKSQKHGHGHTMNQAQAGDAGPQVVELQRRNFINRHSYIATGPNVTVYKIPMSHCHV